MSEAKTGVAQAMRQLLDATLDLIGLAPTTVLLSLGDSSPRALRRGSS